MRMYELLILAVSLSMDAFAVSVCKGLSAGRPRAGHCLLCGAWFGGFQALMPLIGWLLGARFQEAIVSIDHWIAFALLSMIGANMVRGAGGGEELSCSFAPGAMLPLDALAVGITFAFLQVEILPAVLSIGTTTFLLSALGVKVGAASGGPLRGRAEIAGGIVLIGMGAKILAEHILLA